MEMTYPPLSRRPKRQAPTLSLLPGEEAIELIKGRLHEACGPARRTFAVWLAARTEGPVFWIGPEWAQEWPNSEGLRPWAAPQRFVFVSVRRTEDILWTMEEVLRSGTAALSIADMPGFPSLTQVRRMHLAAETGGGVGSNLPLGVLLTPDRGGTPGVETRWHLRTQHASGKDGWQLERLRARMAPPKSWQVERLPPAEGLRIKPA